MRLFSPYILLIFFTSCIMAGKDKSAEEIDVFLIGGQSNARGVGSTNESPVPVAGTVYQFDDSLTLVTDEVANLPDGRGSAWPAFAITYHQLTGRKICFIPCAVDGSYQMPSANFGWHPSNWIFRSSVSKAKTAMKGLKDHGFNPIFKGILWCQGENEGILISRKEITQPDYFKALSEMMAGFREQLGKDLKFYIFQTGKMTTIDDASFKAIRDAQQQLVDSDTLLNIMASNKAITFPARGMMKDSLHWNQKALNEQGTIGALKASR